MSSKTVLVLVDFFLPVKNLLPTIEALIKSQNRLIVVSVFAEESLVREAGRLAEGLGRKFIVLTEKHAKLPDYDVPHLYFTSSNRLLSKLRAGDIAVVENLNKLSKEQIIELKGLIQTFINDDFGADERMVQLLSRNLPTSHGLEFERVKKGFESFARRAKKPLVLVLGGINLAGKEQALDKLIGRADAVLVGGGAANLFFKSQGLEIGRSVIDEEADVKILKRWQRDWRDKIMLPVDVVVAGAGRDKLECIKPTMVKSHHRIYDVGPLTILQFSKVLKQGTTLIWSGALGRTEEKRFAHGTKALLRLFASRSARAHVATAASGESVLFLLRGLELEHRLDVTLPRSQQFLNTLANAFPL